MSKMVFLLHKEIFTISKVKTIPEKVFAGIYYNGVYTVVHDKLLDSNTDILEFEEGWRMLTVDAIMDFNLTGILSQISSLLAESNISLFALSSYDTDHILIKDENLKEAIIALQHGGWLVKPA